MSYYENSKDDTISLTKTQNTEKDDQQSTKIITDKDNKKDEKMEFKNTNNEIVKDLLSVSDEIINYTNNETFPLSNDIIEDKFQTNNSSLLDFINIKHNELLEIMNDKFSEISHKLKNIEEKQDNFNIELLKDREINLTKENKIIELNNIRLRKEGEIMKLKIEIGEYKNKLSVLEDKSNDIKSNKNINNKVSHIEKQKSYDEQENKSTKRIIKITKKESS